MRGGGISRTPIKRLLTESHVRPLTNALLCTKIDRATFDCPLGNPITKQRKPLYYVTYHIQSPNDKNLTFKGPYVGPWYKTGYREGNFFALSMCQTIRVCSVLYGKLLVLCSLDLSPTI